MVFRSSAGLAPLLALAMIFGGSAWSQSPQPPASPSPARGHSTAIRVPGRRGYLGVGVVEVTESRAQALKLKDDSGVEVKRVDENSPAAKAGLHENDVILEVDGKKVNDVGQFIHMISDAEPGTKLALTVWRSGATLTLTATVEARPNQLFAFGFPDGANMPQMPPMPQMPNFGWDGDTFSVMPGGAPLVGFEGETLTPQLAEYFGVKEGVLVRTVAPRMPAEKAGFKAGDVVTKVNGTPVTSPREISSLVRTARKGKVAFTIVRNKREQVLEVEIAERKSQGPDRLQL
jgi:serine protease Do